MAESETPRIRWQEIVVLCGALGIIVVSVVTTLWFSGVFSPESSEEETYRNVTLTDAVLACEKKAYEAHGPMLRQLVLDNLSSRYDTRTGQYKIFHVATMASPKPGGAAMDFYVNCFVNTHRGSVTSFEIYEKRENPTEAIRKDGGGIFGWPNN